MHFTPPDDNRHEVPQPLNDRCGRCKKPLSEPGDYCSSDCYVADREEARAVENDYSSHWSDLFEENEMATFEDPDEPSQPQEDWRAKKQKDTEAFQRIFGHDKADDWFYIGVICFVAIIAYVFGHRSAVQ